MTLSIAALSAITFFNLFSKNKKPKLNLRLCYNIMSSTDRTAPVSYDIIRLDSPRASEILRQSIDPASIFRRAQVYFRDGTIREPYLNNIFKDLKSLTNTRDLHSNIINASNDLKRTKVYESAGVTIDPDNSTESLKIDITPVKKEYPSFYFSQFHLGTSYGIGAAYRKRDIAGILDTLSGNAVLGIRGPIRVSYSLSYAFPIVSKDLGLNFTIAKNYSIFSSQTRGIESFQSIALTKKNILFRFTHANRRNLLNDNNYAGNDPELLPSKKISLSTQAFWDYASSDKTTGNRVVVEAEYGSVQEADKFVKLGLKNDSFFAFNTIQSDVKREPYDLILENSFDFGVTYPLRGGKLRINDRNFQNRMRGFREISDLGDYRGDDVYLKNAVKLYLNRQFPIFNILFTPFAHFSYGYFSGNVFNKAEDARKSALSQTLEWGQGGAPAPAPAPEEKKSKYSLGVGISTRLHPLVTCEFLFNLLSVGSADDKSAVLQFHIGF